MAVGAGPSDVRRQFLAEAMLISLIGGVIGIAIGIVGALIVGKLGNLPVQLNAQVVMLAAAFSIGTGLFFGYYPARKASLLDPDRGAAPAVRLSRGRARRSRATSRSRHGSCADRRGRTAPAAPAVGIEHRRGHIDKGHVAQACGVLPDQRVGLLLARQLVDEGLGLIDRYTIGVFGRSLRTRATKARKSASTCCWLRPALMSLSPEYSTIIRGR